MKPSDRAAFGLLLGNVMAFYRQDVSKFAANVWWSACGRFDFEQVSAALNAHAIDPDRGQFPPKPADIVRVLQGTRTDRSLIAWGKVLDAMQRVGAYTSVAFDDGLIHAAIEDIGGWVQMCQGEMEHLPFVEKRFCESYRAYVSRPPASFPAVLPGVHQLQNAIAGKAQALPMLIGDAAAAREVIRLGGMAPKTQMTPLLETIEQLRLGAQ